MNAAELATSATVRGSLLRISLLAVELAIVAWGVWSAIALVIASFATAPLAWSDLLALPLFGAFYTAGPYLHEYGHAVVARVLGARDVRIEREKKSRIHSMRLEGDVGGTAGVAVTLIAGASATFAAAALCTLLPLPFPLRAAAFAALALRTLEEITLVDGSDLSRLLSLSALVMDRTLRIGDPILRIAGITVRSGERALVDDVSLDLRTGDIIGILGSNGAGKSTLLDVLGGLRASDRGTREIAPGARCAFAPSKAFFLQSATVGEMLNYFAIQSGVPRDRAVEQRLGLPACMNTRIDHASSGELQRLSLAISFAQRADILVLDEPETALDPGGRALVRELLRERSRRGKACVLATHFVADALAFCTHLAIVEGGRLVRFGPIEEFDDLRARAHRLTIWISREGAAAARDADLNLEEQGGEYRAVAVGTVESLIALAARLGGGVNRFELESNRLE